MQTRTHARVAQRTYDVKHMDATDRLTLLFASRAQGNHCSNLKGALYQCYHHALRDLMGTRSHVLHANDNDDDKPLLLLSLHQWKMKYVLNHHSLLSKHILKQKVQIS